MAQRDQVGEAFPEMGPGLCGHRVEFSEPLQSQLALVVSQGKLGRIWMRQHIAIAVHDEGGTGAAHALSGEELRQCGQFDVRTYHSKQLPVGIAHCSCDGKAG